MNRTALPAADCYLSPLRIKMGVDKKVLYMDVTQTSTVAQAYRFVEDKEGQRDFKLMYNNSCLEKDDTQLIYLIDDFASDVVVQPVDGLLGGMEKGKQATHDSNGIPQPITWTISPDNPWIEAARRQDEKEMKEN